MREPRIQSGGRPIRIFPSVDPRAAAILLIDGPNMQRERFDRECVRQADTINDEYIQQLRREGLLESQGRSEA